MFVREGEIWREQEREIYMHEGEIYIYIYMHEGERDIYIYA